MNTYIVLRESVQVEAPSSTVMVLPGAYVVTTAMGSTIRFITPGGWETKVKASIPHVLVEVDDEWYTDTAGVEAMLIRLAEVGVPIPTSDQLQADPARWERFYAHVKGGGR